MSIEYRRIKDLKDLLELQGIVKLLSEYEERVIVRRPKQPELLFSHYLRRTLAVWPDPAELSVWVGQVKTGVFGIVMEGRNNGGSAATRWTHEDGIYMERAEYANTPDHPVHTIVCVHDLWERASADPDGQAHWSAFNE